MKLDDYRQIVLSLWGKNSDHVTLFNSLVTALRKEWQESGQSVEEFCPLWSFDHLWHADDIESSRSFFNCALWFTSSALLALELRLFFRDKKGFEQELSPTDFFHGEAFTHPKTGEVFTGDALKACVYPYVQPKSEFLRAVLAGVKPNEVTDHV